MEDYSLASKIFKYIIVDEYQDTNSIQEQLYFSLAGNKNICVVGDDDQALFIVLGVVLWKILLSFQQECLENLELYNQEYHYPSTTDQKGK